MKFSKHLFFWAILIGLIGCGPQMPEKVKTAYEELPEKIDFNFHVRPILSDRCFACHGPDENARKANLRLDTEEGLFSMLEGKEKFPIVPGKPEDSEVIERVLHDDPEIVMPTPESNLTLTDTEKAILLKWVEQGAEWKTHWAFTAPVKVPLPKVIEPSWAKNEIDYFVLDKLESLGLPPSMETNKTTLIRRLSLDLIGLPPTPEEVQAFKNDTSPNAYENLVDRLLASPAYGERWAWEWLDVARYADTNGFQGDATRNMWPWRDWVIQAFNDNMPYDEFTIKQLAGDLLPNATRNDILATGFNRNHTYNTEGGSIPEETRVTNVFDRVETTGTAWLGLTMNCARCHDHKYDQITQKEYYQMFDYFNQTSEEGGGWGGKLKPLLDLSREEEFRKNQKLQAHVDELVDKVKIFEDENYPREPGVPMSEAEAIKKVKGLDTRILINPPDKRGTGAYRQLANYFKNVHPQYGQLLNQVYEAMQAYDKATANATQVMVMDEAKEPRTTYILDRGGYDKPKMEEPIIRDVPAILPPIPGNTKNNRLALAQWMVSKEQPLTARVTVNRYWQAFFGKGIVKTIDDFGVQSTLPSHPELLDWLAMDFQENGWDLKALFKKIVMSATYRQASNFNSELLEMDPENRYLARATRMRLPSWMLRDQVLYISGLLVDSIGGKPVKPYQPKGIWGEATFGFITYEQDHGDSLYRKSLYTFWRRIVGPTFIFDNSPRQVCTVKKPDTNTPLHALTTLNDITYMEASRVMAEKVLTAKTSDDERIRFLFKWATARAPDAEEIKILKNRLIELRSDYASLPEEARKLIAIGEYPINLDLAVTDYAAYTALSSLVFNLDETITRQ
ncbi:PSD1 and planctomycete cytochrome C domain-containing protein [Ulvibacterium marinum]|uniref:PSD1 and planctomycete cytochrome C domain-containing protein n=1 Tax=Ulvibacterium marinum TaxID=2419782 RepID=UPI00249433E3|nr:PSD1 and planctomycete cytochrome C domain-containing protein [Ulvibacterium marinum]